MLRDVRRISWSDRFLAATTTGLLLVAWVLCATIGETAARRVAGALASVGQVVLVVDPARIPWAVDVGSTLLPVEVTCLPRAIVGQALYEATGESSLIRYGVRWKDGELHAHAWIERGGEAVIGGQSDLDQYRPLDSPGFGDSH